MQSLRKEILPPVWHKKKNEEIKAKNFERPYLANNCCVFYQICYLEYPTWGDSYNERAIELCTHEKAIFFLPVDILTVCVCRLSWPHDTLLCFLIYIYKPKQPSCKKECAPQKGQGEKDVKSKVAAKKLL